MVEYQPSEHELRRRAERNARALRRAPWWRRRRVLAEWAYVDEVLDSVRTDELLRAERRAARAAAAAAAAPAASPSELLSPPSGERRAEGAERADELLGHARPLDEPRVTLPSVVEERVQPIGERGGRCPVCGSVATTS
jgi:hypothetical protein